MFARLLILFITVPLIELFLFAKIGSKIGLPATLVVIIITGALGAWLTKIQGLRTYAKFQRASAEGRLPHNEVIDGLIILVAGAVLLTPGFLTDAVGFSLLVPPIRAVVRNWLGGYLKGRAKVVISSRVNVTGPTAPGSPSPGIRNARQVEGKVFEVETEPIEDKTPDA